MAIKQRCMSFFQGAVLAGAVGATSLGIAAIGCGQEVGDLLDAAVAGELAQLVPGQNGQRFAGDRQSPNGQRGLAEQQALGEPRGMEDAGGRGDPGQPPTDFDPNQPPPPGQQPPLDPIMATLDADGDGELSADEIAAAPDTLLLLDADADGTLDRGEVGPPPPPLPDDFVERVLEHDRDGDGLVTPAELLDPRAKVLFAEADGDGDGALTADELGVWFEENAPPAPPMEDAQ